jgi:hypothetical protein
MRLRLASNRVAHERAAGPACHRTLTRYWFPLSSGAGIGVTESSEREARRRAEATRQQFFPASMLGAPVVNVDINTLDADVQDNMGPAVVRGVWFPRLNL